MGVVPGVLHGLGNDLHTDNLSGGGGHSQRDGAYAAVQVEDGVLLRNTCQRNGGFVEPLGLMVVHLIERPGGQPEVQTAEGVLDIARAIERHEFVSQHGVALFRIDAEHQRGKAGDSLQSGKQRIDLGQFLPVAHKAHQNLFAYRAPANVDVPQKASVAGFVVDGYPELVDIIHNRILDGIGFLRQNQAPPVFHHIVGAGPKKTGIGAAFFCRHGVLGLVSVAVAVGGGENGHLRQGFPCQPVQAGLHPLRFQPGFLGVVHVPEIAAAAELGDRAFPVHPVGGLFENFHDFSRRPGFLGFFDAQPHPLPGNGVGQEYGAPLHMGDALPFGGVVGDGGFVNLVLNEHYSFASM